MLELIASQDSFIVYTRKDRQPNIQTIRREYCHVYAKLMARRSARIKHMFAGQVLYHAVPADEWNSITL